MSLTSIATTPADDRRPGTSVAEGSEPTSKAAKRLSRSPKRIRSTPPLESTARLPDSATTLLHPAKSTRPGEKRPSLSGKRGVSFERHVMTSPWKKDDTMNDTWGVGLSSRRREASVPLLSESLSSFSLSRTSPTFGLFSTQASASANDVTPPSFPFPSMTPSSQHASLPSSGHTLRHTPSTSFQTNSTPSTGLPTDHPHPSTAPLPQLPTFLGSPFSSKTARGGYNFRNFSPCKSAMTEKIGQNGFETVNLDWLDNSEWMIDDEHDHFSRRREDRDFEGHHDIPHQCPELRRDASSASSIDDYSTSGASSTSLPSLGRSSGESSVRPNLVSVWGEGEMLEYEEEDDPETPSRQLFPLSTDLAGDTLEMGKSSPGDSPLVGKSAARPLIQRQQSPLQVFFMQTPGASDQQNSDVTPPATLPHTTYKSPLSSLLPRLVSSTKSAKKSSIPTPSSVRSDHEHGLNHPSSTHQTPAYESKLPRRSIPKSLSNRGLNLTPVLIETTVNGTSRFSGNSRSNTSASSGSSASIETDIEASPSKIARPSTSHTSSSSSVATNANSPVGPARAALVARRKTMGSQSANKANSSMSAMKSSRPPLRRGITDPKHKATSTLLTPNTEVHTPVSALFGDTKPSPAAFASTGLVKKKSGLASVEIPKFGYESEPMKKVSGLPAHVQPVKSRMNIMIASSQISDQSSPTSPSSRNAFTHNRTKSKTHRSTGSMDPSVQVHSAQQTRGLRRKTSTMFTSSGSSGSVGDSSMGSNECRSPATPTKPGMLAGCGLGISTPSPTQNQVQYPFASATMNHASTPMTSSRHPSSVAEEASSPVDAVPLRLRQLGRGPIARSSNPMLAESFRADAARMTNKTTAKIGSSGHVKLSGSRLDKDFAIVQSLGKGEFSQVWKVQDKVTGGLFAVKAGQPYTGHKNRLRQLEEVSILRQLSLNPHPHVLDFIDSWEHSNCLFIRTELAHCGNLSTFLLSIADFGGLDEIRVWKTLFELSSGLQYIHSSNFVHLDIKPSNILITSSGALKIGDFGLSTLISPDGEIGGLSPAIPQSGQDGQFVWHDMRTDVPVPSPILDREMEGDREYLCPEALGESAVGVEADIYSLGILLLEAGLNVVLPSNGEAWVKLRNDDFTDCEEHYIDRASFTGSSLSASDQGSLPIISQELLDVVKRMMISDRSKRLTIQELDNIPVMKRMREIGQKVDGITGQEDVKMTEGSEMAGMQAALVEEGEWFMPFILGLNGAT